MTTCKKFILEHAYKLLKYDEDNGIVYKEDHQPWRRVKRNITRRISSDGYTTLSFDTNFGKKFSFSEHRICWYLFHREIPEIVDHINGDRSDNRIGNLRSCNHSQNMQNRILKKGKYPRNVSMKKDGFYVKIRSNGVTHVFGAFDSIEEAEKVSIEQRKKLHGDFAKDA